MESKIIASGKRERGRVKVRLGAVRKAMRQLLRMSKAAVQQVNPKVMAWIKRQELFSTELDFPDIAITFKELFTFMMYAGIEDMAAQVAALQKIKPTNTKVASAVVHKFSDWVAVVPEDALKWLDTYVPQLARVTEEALRTKCRDTIAEGLRDGLTGDEVKKRLETTFKEFSEARLETIVRTESMRAYNLGALMGMRKSVGVAGVEFFAIMDERVTPQCEARNGMQLRLDDPHIINNTPPMHPRCRSVLIPLLVDEVPPDWKGEGARAEQLAFEHPGIQRDIDLDVVRKLWEISVPPTAATAATAATVATAATTASVTEDFVDHIKPSAEYLEEYRAHVTRVQPEVLDATAWKRYLQNQEHIPAKLEKLFTSDESVVVTRLKSSNVSKVLEDGRLKSQFETFQSGGLLDTGVRSQFEKDFFGYAQDISPKLRPIYGEILDKADVQPWRNQYGDTLIVFKSSVKKHTTFTVGDSLDNYRAPQQLPSPVLRPSAASIRTRDLAREELSTEDISHLVFTTGSSYCEIQIHNGAATLENIERIVFSKKPGPRIVALLAEKAIPWEVKATP